MGSGWGALVWEPLAGRLLTTQIYDHQSNLSQAGVPLLVIDAWEHAYYLQYKNRKTEFFEAVWNLWNWEDVAAALPRGQQARRRPGGRYAATSARAVRPAPRLGPRAAHRRRRLEHAAGAVRSPQRDADGLRSGGRRGPRFCWSASSRATGRIGCGAPFVGPEGGSWMRRWRRPGSRGPGRLPHQRGQAFQVRERGESRRIHQKPNTSELRRAGPWLCAELGAGGPRVIVSLGATAARSLAAVPPRGRLRARGSRQFTLPPRCALRSPRSAIALRARLARDLRGRDRRARRADGASAPESSAAKRRGPRS